MKVWFYDIVWDTDGEDVDLPSSVELVSEDDLSDFSDLSDLLSDKFGFCVISFNHEIVYH